MLSWNSSTWYNNICKFPISGKYIRQRNNKVQWFLSLVEEGDQVMADKGFLIQDLLETKKAKLTIPPFLSRTKSLQFTAKEVTDTEQIARLRIHDERAIRRIKEYQIFVRVLPVSLAGSVNQVWTICCLLTNFRGPLYRNFDFPLVLFTKPCYNHKTCNTSTKLTKFFTICA